MGQAARLGPFFFHLFLHRFQYSRTSFCLASCRDLRSISRTDFGMFLFTTHLPSRSAKRWGLETDYLAREVWYKPPGGLL